MGTEYCRPLCFRREAHPLTWQRRELWSRWSCGLRVRRARTLHRRALSVQADSGRACDRATSQTECARVVHCRRRLIEGPAVRPTGRITGPSLAYSALPILLVGEGRFAGTHTRGIGSSPRARTPDVMMSHGARHVKNGFQRDGRTSQMDADGLRPRSENVAVAVISGRRRRPREVGSRHADLHGRSRRPWRCHGAGHQERP